jgi:hypothetical protein
MGRGGWLHRHCADEGDTPMAANLWMKSWLVSY